MDTKDNLVLLEAEINSLLKKLGAVPSGTEEHDELVGRLGVLTDIRNGYYSAASGEVIPEKKRWIDPLKPESIIGGVVSLASLYLIMRFEKADIIVTKGFSIVSKWIGR